MKGAATIAMALLAAAAPPAPDPVLGTGRGLDHVMVWTAEPGTATAALHDRLGFEVRDGGDFGNGIANRLIRFPDHSYLELLSLNRPPESLAGDAADAYAFLKAGPGASTFALETSDMDGAARTWASRKLDLYPEEPNVYDPDGPGPQPAQTGLFRTLFLKERALRSGDLFLVSYRLKRPEGFRHANGAIGLTAIWLVTPDLAADAQRLGKLGLRRERTVALPRYGAHGLVLAAGRGHVVLLAPDGPRGRAAEALRLRPGRIFAISIAVAALEPARRLVERGWARRLPRYPGLWGAAFEAPTEAALGFPIEFHATR